VQQEGLKHLLPRAPLFTAPLRPYRLRPVGGLAVLVANDWAWLMLLINHEYRRRQGMAVDAAMGCWN